MTIFEKVNELIEQDVIGFASVGPSILSHKRHASISLKGNYGSFVQGHGDTVEEAMANAIGQIRETPKPDVKKQETIDPLTDILG